MIQLGKGQWTFIVVVNIFNIIINRRALPISQKILTASKYNVKIDK